MLRYLKLLLPILLAITLFSCDLREPRRLPTAMEIATQPTEDYYLVTEVYYTQDREDPYFWIEVLSKEPVESVRLGDQLLSVDSFYFSGYNGYYNYDFDSPDSLWAILDGHDEYLDYEINFAESTVSGSLQFPSEYGLIDPDFDFMQDLSLEWILLKNPRKQVLDVSFRDSDANYVSYYKELDPSTRTHMIPKTFWTHLSDFYRAGIELSAYNYKFHEDGLACFISTLDYNSGSLSSLKNPSRHFQQIFSGMETSQN